MKLKIKEIKANPFKKYIQDGQLNQERIEMFKESINHGTLPENFRVRKHNDEYQICSGHHRLETIKQVKGNDYEVNVELVDFTDEQMLIDLVRENITQRDTDYHDTREGIVLARQWLQSKVPTVKQFDNRLKDGTLKGSEPLPDSYRSIATFLSKNGKSLTYQTVKNYLDVTDKLNPELIPMIHKVSGNKAPEDVITVKQALALSKFEDYEEQKDLLNAMKRMNGRPHEYITAYKNAPENIKQQVKKGEIQLSDINDEIDKDFLKQEAEKRPKTIFIPNFTQRMKDFNSNVTKLERQIQIFSKIFHSPDFKERYYSLKPRQQQDLNAMIFNIKKRIKECHDEVDFFMEQLSERNILLEEKQ